MSTTKLTLAQKVANLNTPLTWDNIQNKPPFGTEANTILEGSKFIEGLGVNGYGGTIQDPGQKVAGKCYFDINTKSLFLCKTTNNLTSPNSDYFTSFDNKSLLNKLENLLIFKLKDIAYNGGAPIPNGSSYRLPDGINTANVRYYALALRDAGNIVKYVSLFGSSNLDTNTHNFDGIILEYTGSTNVLRVIRNTTIANIGIIRFLTYPI